jgi:ribosome maturation factor RimP
VTLRLYRPYEGEKTLHGVLEGLANETIVIRDETGNRVCLPRTQVAATRLDIE